MLGIIIIIPNVLYETCLPFINGKFFEQKDISYSLIVLLYKN